VRRRRTRHAVGAALTLGCAALALLVWRGGALGRMGKPTIVVHKPITEFVPFKEAKVEMMSDADLARELRAVGIDAGVATVNGKTHLIASDGKRYEPPLALERAAGGKSERLTTSSGRRCRRSPS
jgi:hypothetical protein